MDLLRFVVAPAVRMALKLHQDHFAAGDDFDDADLLYQRITQHLSKLFISHEVFFLYFLYFYIFNFIFFIFYFYIF